MTVGGFDRNGRFADVGSCGNKYIGVSLLLSTSGNTCADQKAGRMVEIRGEATDMTSNVESMEPSDAKNAAVDEATGLKIALLEQSFENVKPVANEFIASFYGNLFEDYPAAQPLFAHTDMADQGQKLLMSLVFVIENLRDPAHLTDTLKGLGARHVQYGALPSHYPLVGSTLLKTFEQYLQADVWTPEVKQAWTDAYGLITTVMLEGADYQPEEVQLR